MTSERDVHCPTAQSLLLGLRSWPAAAQSATSLARREHAGLGGIESYSGQVSVGGDVVALDYLAGLRVLLREGILVSFLKVTRRSWVCLGAVPYLVVAGPHEGIVAKVAADVSRDDLAVDAIARDEILVLASSGGRGRGRALVAGGS